MFKKLKFNVATNRVGRKTTKKSGRTKKRISIWTRIKNIIVAPFRLLARIGTRIWKWIKSINVIGLINATLLCAIIVLFSMLIIDYLRFKDAPTQTPVITSIAPVAVEPTLVKSDMPTLPLARDAKTNVFITKTINVVKIQPDTVACKQIAKTGKKIHGDTIIDSRGTARMLESNTTINGNLYLQNMRKYTLPCDVKINGNLFLRDMGMLQFCGKFTVNGNIYVSPSSSFGPLPRNATIRGNVII